MVVWITSKDIDDVNMVYDDRLSRGFCVLGGHARYLFFFHFIFHVFLVSSCSSLAYRQVTGTMAHDSMPDTPIA